MNQSKIVITCSWQKARENVCEWVAIGFGFTSDWMKKWREFFKPIVWRTKCKKKLLFDTQMKTALSPEVRLALISSQRDKTPFHYYTLLYFVLLFFNPSSKDRIVTQSHPMSRQYAIKRKGLPSRLSEKRHKSSFRPRHLQCNDLTGATQRFSWRLSVNI